ncbi:MAG: NUDIX hydrolase [Candidatus Woesearchaeota archaeon]|jgi:mutator protein MutT
MNTRKVALMIFYDKQKKILLQERKTISKVGEEWGFFGGKIKSGETPDQAIKREIKEELDYEIHVYKFLGISKQKIAPELYVEGHIFIAPLGNKMSQFKLQEGDGMKLFSFSEAKQLKMVTGDNQVIEIIEKSI